MIWTDTNRSPHIYRAVTKRFHILPATIQSPVTYQLHQKGEVIADDTSDTKEHIEKSVTYKSDRTNMEAEADADKEIWVKKVAA